MQKIVEDKDLGMVILRKNIRSRLYTIRLRQGKVSVSMPLFGSYKHAIELLNIHRESLYEKLKKYPPVSVNDSEEKKLRKQAKEYLPQRLELLASKYGFSYNSVKITKSKGRWGSCSSKKNINLSLYLMKLPPYLIDYVILHELCHTKEMNHGPQFWLLMDQVTGGIAKKLKKELKQVSISLYSKLD